MNVDRATFFADEAERFDFTALHMHCLAAGMPAPVINDLEEVVRAAVAFGYSAPRLLCWSASPQYIDDDGQWRSFPASGGQSNVWYRLTCDSVLDSEVPIALLDFDDEALKRVDLIPFTFPEVAHEA